MNGSTNKCLTSYISDYLDMQVFPHTSTFFFVGVYLIIPAHFSMLLSLPHSSHHYQTDETSNPASEILGMAFSRATSRHFGLKKYDEAIAEQARGVQVISVHMCTATVQMPHLQDLEWLRHVSVQNTNFCLTPKDAQTTADALHTTALPGKSYMRQKRESTSCELPLCSF